MSGENLTFEEKFIRQKQVAGALEEEEGILTGFPELDKIVGGLRRSDLIVVGGRPGMGKTSFALNIARHVASKHKGTVAIFSLEESNRKTINRLLTAESAIAGKKLHLNALTFEEQKKVFKAVENLARLPIHINDTPIMMVADVERAVQLMNNLELIVVDYLQLLLLAEKRENRAAELAEILRDLKALATKLKVPVLITVQVPRHIDKREDRRPILSDLRESDVISQYANQVLFLYRPNYYHPSTDLLEDIAEVIVAKNQHGNLGTAKLAFCGECSLYTSLYCGTREKS